MLVERCFSSYEWEEAPEDLALSLSQLSLLWVAIASCGGQGQGAQRVGAQLTRIVSKSVANASNPVSGGAGSRGVDQMVRRHAEACAFILLKISSPSPSPSPRCEAASAADSSFVTTLLESALPSGSRDGLVAAPEGRSASKSEADKFLWRVLRTCCTAYPCQLVRSALEAVCTPLNSQSSDVLRILLSSASDSWHLDGDNRVATLLLLSWCISASTSSGGVDIATSDRGADCAVGSRLVPAPTTGRDAVSSALNALSSSQKKSLNLAVSLLSSQLSSADRSLLGNIF